MKHIKTALIQNQAFQNVFKNASVLFSGTVGSQLLGLASIAILTKSLSVEMFGIYALVVAFISLLDRLTSFQTWKALLHYGIKAQETGDKSLLLTLLAAGLLLDILGGMVGFILALIFTKTLPMVFGIETVPLSAIIICASTLCFNWFSSCTALFRIYNRYAPQVYFQILLSGLNLIAFLALWLLNIHDLSAYLIAWTVTTIIGRLYFLVSALYELRCQDMAYRELLNFKQLKHKTPKFLSFVITTNLDGIVRVLRDIDVFIINAILGPAAVGLYKIAQTAMKFAGRLIDPIYQTIYPELMRLLEKGNKKQFEQLMRYSSLTLGIAMIILLFGFAIMGKWALGFMFGEVYKEAYAVTLLCLVSVAIWGAIHPLSPAIISYGKAKAAFNMHLASAIIYIFSLIILIYLFGLVGSGVALCIFHLLWGFLAFTYYKKVSRK